MCGRFTQTQPATVIAQIFQLAEVPEISPQYNIAPSHSISTIFHPTAPDPRTYKQLQWGLIPHWAKDPKIGNKLINARAETVAEKPSFRQAFQKRRCLVIADGFYEWKTQPNQKQKQPYYFHLQNHQPFAFAGLWEQWKDPTGQTLETCTIITTEANEIMAPIHDRMPVILAEKDYEQWLDPALNDSSKIQPLLHPFPASEMLAYPVSTKVNKPSVNFPELINSL